MGWNPLKKIEKWGKKQLKSAKKAFTHPRDWLSNAIPTAGALTGNPLLQFGGAAAGNALAGDPMTLKSIGQTAIGGAKDAAGIGAVGLGAYLGGQALGGIGGGGAGAGGTGGGAAAASAPASAASSSVPGLGILKSAGGWALKNPELVLGAYSAYEGAKQQGKANKMNEEALRLAREPWEETKALRAMAIQDMVNNKAPDLSGIYEGMSNPFSRPLRSVRRSGGVG